MIIYDNHVNLEVCRGLYARKHQKAAASCSIAMTTMPKEAKSRQNWVYISWAGWILLTPDIFQF